MSKSDAKIENTENWPSADEALRRAGHDAGHDEWVRAKIEVAIEDADRHPERRIPIKEVWKKFGLED